MKANRSIVPGSALSWTSALVLPLALLWLAGCVDDTVNVYNTPPELQLIAPLDQEVFGDGTATFQGRVDDGQDAPEELLLSWTSSLLEEPLNTEVPDSTGFIQFTYQGLPPGDHLITFTATDTREATDSETITIFVPTDPPLVTIESPLTGETYLEGETIQFQGMTRTADGEPASMSVIWESDIQGGEIHVSSSDSSGLTLFSMVLDPGNHVITLNATDENGISGQDIKVVEVSEYPPGMLDQDGEGFCPDGIDVDGNGLCEGEEITGPGTQDCDDYDPTICPGCDEICDAKPDNNCDGELDLTDMDVDTDTWSECMGDCDDGNPLMNPDEIEVCDGFDNDCNGLIDENDQDLDADGFGL